MELINNENQFYYLPLIKKYLPEEEKEELLAYIENYEKLITYDDINEKGNEIALQQIDLFFEEINAWLKDELILIPEEELQEAKKKTIKIPQTTRSTYSFKKNKPTIATSRDQLPINKNNLSEIAKKGFSDAQKTTNKLNIHSIELDTEKLPTTRSTYINKEKTLKKKENPINPEISPTTRSTYQLTQKQQTEIKEIQLPDDKIYIYQETRRMFGQPVNTKILLEYGVNRFARKIINNYPSKYKMTEIKSVLQRIRDYDKIMS